MIYKNSSYKTPGHLYDDLKRPSFDGNNGEFGVKDFNLRVSWDITHAYYFFA